MKKIKQLFACMSLMAFGLGTVQAEYALNLMKGVTKISNDIYDLHMLILWICVAIGVVVFGVMFYSIFHHRKSVGHKAEQFHENTRLEIIWTIIPFLILVGMAVPATKVMIEMDDIAEPDLSIKVTGYQWKWKYDYLDEDISFFSTLDAESNRASQVGSDIDPATVPHYLLNVDNPLVIPTKKKVRFLFTAADVVHSWWVPDLGWKKDTNPGFINEAWTQVDKPGTFRGQCAELCGRGHAFMPIVVIAMDQPDYDIWVESQKGAATAEAGEVDKQWSSSELIAKGESVYQSNCSSCHMANGEGMPGTFPAITGNAIVKGNMDGQVQLVLNGKDMMPAFAEILSATDLAAIITYTRNALGNNVGDSIQPSDIQTLLNKMPKEE